ncbi:head maturation protease, ClpP-related [Azospirillum doebereinerae]|uniref:ATP-dependent Clp protease proteolytic subunit n=1 Tax=Azospirillum doebereinerae TaxID=92933 RepID=A0A433J4X1_9PROT|nr:head maturation protease, ClpP-related [Azospirillum doebereinerae]RUQ67453.1 hypothetical protein EJ913_19720 [Azospirillum doebereinerae]
MAKWYEIKAAAEGSGQSAPTIFLYDEIGYWGTTARDFADDLKALGPVTDLTVRINCGGGEFFAGLAINNLLRTHPAKVTVKIDAFAGSIASVIAMAGDVVEMPANAMMMIHNVSWWASGTAEDLRETALIMDQMRKSLVAAYRAKTGLDETRISELLTDGGTWMTAAEAKDLGFCDVVTGAVDATNFAAVTPGRFAAVPAAVAGKLSATPPRAQSPTAPNGDSMSKPQTPTAPTAGTQPPAGAATPEAELRAQLAAEAEANAGKRSPVPGETPEAMTARLRAEAAEITDLCEIAGCPRNAAGYIRKGLTPQSVRAELLKRDVAQFERSSVAPVTVEPPAAKAVAIDAAAAYRTFNSPKA